VVGPLAENEVQERIAYGPRGPPPHGLIQGAKIDVLGDTCARSRSLKGDKVEAQIKFGLSVNTYGSVTSLR